MKQYEIWWANLPGPAGRRPVMLLSRDDAYAVLNKVIAVEITSKIRGIPIEVRLGKADGLSRTCVANFDNLRTITKTNLGERISRLPYRRFAEVKRAVGYALGWDKLIEVSAS